MAGFHKSALEIIDTDSDFSPELPYFFDSTSLAYRLGIQTRTLMYLIIKKSEHYKIHTIPKKSGGLRIIHAPSDRIKFVQSKLLEVLLNKLKYPDCVGAYVQGKTTRETAQVHAGKPLLIVIDLKDFFPSTRRAWIRQFFNKKLGYSHTVSSLLADLTTVPIETPAGIRHVVPQGAPTSGAVCNWVAYYKLDVPIQEVCKKYNMAYTRYADDLAFSNTERLDRPITDSFLREIGDIIKASGYRINRKKLRVVRSGRQQRLLGMTINEKPNIMRQHARNLRARIHHCKTKGFDQVASEMGISSGNTLRMQIEGMLSYYHMINPVKADQLKVQLAQAKAAHGIV